MDKPRVALRTNDACTGNRDPGGATRRRQTNAGDAGVGNSICTTVGERPGAYANS
ncbi:MAG: hypothetical protein V9H26_28230 [Verrucomicrobiota bacterium]